MLGATHSTTKTAEKETRLEGSRFVLIVGLNILLAIAFRYSQQLATLHALFVFVLGIWFVVHDRNPNRVVYLLGYICGAEILWRMTEAHILWEYGKYASSAIALLAILRWRMKLKGAPLVYFLFLIPSSLITLMDFPLGDARNSLSFNLSGPFSLMVGALLLSRFTFDRQKLLTLINCTVAPITGIAALAVYSISRSSYLVFTLNSNFATSGGFGPNQVSAVLGLGAVLCWVAVLIQTRESKQPFIHLLLLVWLISQAMITFSRGGVFNFIVAVPIGTIFLLKNNPSRSRTVLAIALGVIVVAYIAFPYLNTFTGGMLQQRLTDLDPTGRNTLINEDLQIFMESPLFGVGPGQSSYYHSLLSFAAASHTEYSRLFAEHGIFGILALFFLIGMVVKAFLDAPSAESRGIILIFALWGLAEMAHAAMRIQAISFLLALSIAQYRPDENINR